MPGSGTTRPQSTLSSASSNPIRPRHDVRRPHAQSRPHGHRHAPRRGLPSALLPPLLTAQAVAAAPPRSTTDESKAARGTHPADARVEARARGWLPFADGRADDHRPRVSPPGGRTSATARLAAAMSRQQPADQRRSGRCVVGRLPCRARLPRRPRVDGPFALHDAYRIAPTNGPALDRVQREAQCPRRTGAAWHAMCVVRRANVCRPLVVYRFLARERRPRRSCSSPTENRWASSAPRRVPSNGQAQTQPARPSRGGPSSRQAAHASSARPGTTCLPMTTCATSSACSRLPRRTRSATARRAAATPSRWRSTAA